MRLSRRDLIKIIAAMSLNTFLFRYNRVNALEILTTNEDEYFCSWSPDSSKILYNFDNQLWILDIRDKSKIQLTKSGMNFDGEFSPDGNKIAFVSENKSENRSAQNLLTSICVMDLIDKKTRCLTNKGFNCNPVWSPDGRKIAFIKIEFGRHAKHIWVMDADGSNQTPLTQDLGSIECWTPKWSPDGKRIVFSTFSNTGWSIWLMDADGGNKRKLADGYYPQWVSENEITYVSGNKLYRFSLDGKNNKKELIASLGDESIKVYYSINKNGDVVYDSGHNISIIHNGRKTKITRTGHEGLPIFSPDGEKIAFMSNRSGNLDIWLITWEIHEKS